MYDPDGLTSLLHKHQTLASDCRGEACKRANKSKKPTNVAPAAVKPRTFIFAAEDVGMEED